MTDDLKKRLKETADKISNSKSAQNITTQTPKPTITPKTTTTNKTGIAKNETIPTPPKSRLISRSDDDLLKNWNHRAFLEGFYEVDGTTNDWEREKRMSLVDEALKDIEERNRKTNKTPGFANYANASNTATTAGGATRPPTQEELEAAYADMQQELSGKNTGRPVAWRLHIGRT